jgi:hypothetical protein
MITTVTLAAVFISGTIAAMITLICASIRCEETKNSLCKKPATRASAATRRLARTLPRVGELPERS